jgi:hypothetical protein
MLSKGHARTPYTTATETQQRSHLVKQKRGIDFDPDLRPMDISVSSGRPGVSGFCCRCQFGLRTTVVSLCVYKITVMFSFHLHNLLVLVQQYVLCMERHN